MIATGQAGRFVGAYLPKENKRIYRTYEARMIWIQGPFPRSCSSLHRVARKRDKAWALARAYSHIHGGIRGCWARGMGLDGMVSRQGRERASAWVAHVLFTILRFRLYCSFDNG